MINQGRLIHRTTLIAACAVLLLSFQQCAAPVSFLNSAFQMSTGQNQADNQAENNGLPYWGKVYANFNDEACAGPNVANSIIIFRQTNLAHLTREHCVDLISPVALDASEFAIDLNNSDYLIYKRLTYEATIPQNRQVSFVQKMDAMNRTPSDNFSSSAFSSVPRAGDLIVCTIFFNSQTANIAGMVDSAGNNYRPASPGGPSAVIGASFSAEIWYAHNVLPGVPNQSVAVTFSALIPGMQAMVCGEYSSSGLPLTLDQVYQYSDPNPSSPGVPTNVGSIPILAGTPTVIFGGFWGNNTMVSPGGAGFTTVSTLSIDLYLQKVAYQGSSVNLSAVFQSSWLGLFATFK